MKRSIGALLLILCLLFAATPLYAAITPGEQRLPVQSSDDILDRIAAIKSTVTPQRSSFNDASGDWETGGDGDVQRSYGPGSYQLQIVAANTVGWGTAPLAAGDFYAEVDAYHVAGPLDNEFGILFRDDGDSYYVYNVSSDGFFRLHKWLNEEWVSVVEWAESSAIVTGEGSHNRLGILADGSTISLLVNDTVLATVNDDSISGDGLALAAGSFDEGGVQIAFDDFTLWATVGDSVDEPVAAATPTAVLTPEPVEEAQATLDPELVQTLVEPIRGNTPAYADDFRRAGDRWPTVKGKDGSITFANRGLNIRIDQPNVALWTSNQEVAALEPADLLVEVDARREAGAFDSTYGLLVRFIDHDNYYYFGVSAAGTYSFWRVVAGEWTKLVDWTTAAAIATEEGATNRLAVLAQGDRFLLLVNDMPLVEAVDATFVAGSVGLYAGVYAEAGLDVTFDNLQAWVLSETVLSEAETTLSADSAALQATQAQVDEVRTGDPTYHARFSRDDGAWSLGDDDNATIAIARGGLRVDVHSPQWLAWAANQAQVSDFQLEADITLANPGAPGEAGLVFRQQGDSNFYFFAIENTGRYSLWKKVAGEWQTLAPWARSDLLDTTEGAKNRIGVLAQGDSLTLILNEQVVATIADDSFQSGSLALAAGAFAEGGVAVTFDNLSLWDLSAP